MPPPHRRRSPWLWVAAGALLVALSASRGALADGAESIGTVTSPIVGGTAAATCNWASTAFLGDCTAVLIHPRVLVTAAHCAPKAGDRVTFGERTPWAFTIVTSKCVTSGEAERQPGLGVLRASGRRAPPQRTDHSADSWLRKIEVHDARRDRRRGRFRPDVAHERRRRRQTAGPSCVHQRQQRALRRRRRRRAARPLSRRLRWATLPPHRRRRGRLRVENRRYRDRPRRFRHGLRGEHALHEPRPAHSRHRDERGDRRHALHGHARQVGARPRVRRFSDRPGERERNVAQLFARAALGPDRHLRASDRVRWLGGHRRRRGRRIGRRWSRRRRTGRGRRKRGKRRSDGLWGDGRGRRRDRRCYRRGRSFTRLGGRRRRRNRRQQRRGRHDGRRRSERVRQSRGVQLPRRARKAAPVALPARSLSSRLRSRRAGDGSVKTRAGWPAPASRTPLVRATCPRREPDTLRS